MENCRNATEDATEAILAFDTFYTNNHMKILKLLFPYVEYEHQKKLAVYIKWQEFIFTLHFLNHPCLPSAAKGELTKTSMNFTSLYPLLSSYCSPKEQEFLSKISGIMNMRNMMDQVQEYLPLIQGLLSAEGKDRQSSPIDIMKNFLSEEQLAMFSMFMETSPPT